MSKVLSIATAFAGGVAAGITIGYLTAPRSGEATRREIQERAARGAEQVSEAIDNGKERVKSLPPAMVAASNAASEAFKDRIGEPAKANGAQK